MARLGSEASAVVNVVGLSVGDMVTEGEGLLNKAVLADQIIPHLRSQVLDNLNAMRTEFGNGVCTMISIANLTGADMKLVRVKNFHGSPSRKFPPPSSIGPGQVGAFIHGKAKLATTGSKAAVIYTAETASGENMYVLLAFDSSFIIHKDRHVYTDVKNEDNWPRIELPWETESKLIGKGQASVYRTYPRSMNTPDEDQLQVKGRIEQQYSPLCQFQVGYPPKPIANNLKQTLGVRKTASKQNQPESLPQPWQEHWDDQFRRTYYYNPTTGESVWEQPTHVSIPSIPASKQNQPEPLSHPWQEHWHDQFCRVYYYNSMTGESVWERPAAPEKTGSLSVPTHQPSVRHTKRVQDGSLPSTQDSPVHTGLPRRESIPAPLLSHPLSNNQSPSVKCLPLPNKGPPLSPPEKTPSGAMLPPPPHPSLPFSSSVPGTNIPPPPPPPPSLPSPSPITPHTKSKPAPSDSPGTGRPFTATDLSHGKTLLKKLPDLRTSKGPPPPLPKRTPSDAALLPPPPSLPINISVPGANIPPPPPPPPPPSLPSPSPITPHTKSTPAPSDSPGTGHPFTATDLSHARALLKKLPDRRKSTEGGGLADVFAKAINSRMKRIRRVITDSDDERECADKDDDQDRSSPK